MTTRAQMRDAALDALAVLLAAERGDAKAIDAMFATYQPGTREYVTFISAILAHALLAVRTAAIASGITPERLLGGVAAEVRRDTA